MQRGVPSLGIVRWLGKPVSTSSLHRRLELVGIATCVAFVTWIATVGAVAGGHSLSMVGLVLTLVSVTLASQWVGKARPLDVPLVISGAPAIALILNRTSFFGDGPLGYSNASGALYFIAACAAMTIAIRMRRRIARTAAYLVAGIWILMPWVLRADAAALLGLILVFVMLAVRRPSGVRAIFLAGVALSLAGLTFTALLGGIGYRPAERETVVDEWFDANLGELRVVLWGESLDLVRQQPITGVGPGRFGDSSPTARLGDDPNSSWAHNEYLQVASETGIPGLILLLTLVTWGFAQLWPDVSNLKSLPIMIALGGVTLHANIDYIWHFPEVPIALAALVGAGSMASARVPEAGIDQLQRRARVSLLSTLALWGILKAPIPLMNPLATVPNGARWIEDEPGIHFVDRGVVRSADEPTSLYRRIMEAGAFSLELWAASREVDQGGPARIVSASDGTLQRNFTIGQEGDSLVFRLRTTRTDSNGIDMQLNIADVFETTDLQHLVLVTDASVSQVYVDGVLRWDGPGPGGSLEAWNSLYPLLIGNETTGDRPWSGRVDFLAIYDRLLPPSEIQRGYGSGLPRLIGSSTMIPGALARYTFEERGGVVIEDRSEARLGGALRVAARILGQDRDLSETLLTAEGSPLARVWLHSVLFAVWAGLLLMAGVDPSLRARTVVLVLGSGSLAMLAVTITRYSEGRSPSVWDILGSGVGLAVGVVIAAMCSTCPPERPSER